MSNQKQLKDQGISKEDLKRLIQANKKNRSVILTNIKKPKS